MKSSMPSTNTAQRLFVADAGLGEFTFRLLQVVVNAGDQAHQIEEAIQESAARFAALRLGGSHQTLSLQLIQPVAERILLVLKKWNPDQTRADMTTERCRER